MITNIYNNARILTGYSLHQLLLVVCIGCQLSITTSGHLYLHVSSGFGKQMRSLLFQEKQYMLQEPFKSKSEYEKTKEEEQVMEAFNAASEALDAKYYSSRGHRSQLSIEATSERETLIKDYFVWKQLSQEGKQYYTYLRYVDFLKNYVSYPPIRSTIKNPPLNVGLSYDFHMFMDCAVELNYLNFSTLIEMFPPESMDESSANPNTKKPPLIKNTFLHGIYVLGKPKYSIFSKLKCYPQLGLGGFWGITNHIDPAQGFMRIPLSATLLLGGGIEYQLSKRIRLDCSWSYGIIYDINHLNHSWQDINSFHLFKGSIAYCIF